MIRKIVRSKEHGSSGRRQVLATLAIAEHWTRLAEIGVWKAGTPAFLLPLAPWLSWTGVDAYAAGTGAYGGRDMEALYRRAAERVAPFGERARLLRANSVEAATWFSDSHFDAVYIDACHDYAAVRADIAAWAPKVRPGDGWLMGHDIDQRGVREAVTDALGTYQLFPDRTWGVRL